MKKVLIVAYHYPPEGGSSGVLRALKFSKYLPANGWIPHVITLRESFYPVTDEELMRDVPPEAVVHRTLALDSARHLAVKGRHFAFLAVPDRFVSWVLFGVPRGLKVIRSEGIRAIYSTCPPPTAHLIGMALRSITGLPWIADFRDPWIEEGSFPSPGSMRYRVELGLERMVMRSCDLLVVTTPYLKREFLSRYPELPEDKVRVIYNGYDESDFLDGPALRRTDRFEIIHAGLVTPEFRNPLPLLSAVADLIEEGILPREKVQVTFLGGDSWVSSLQFAGEVERLGLDGVVCVKARVSHREALQCLTQSAVLLLLQASEDTRSLIPAKAFEYLRIGRPILALTLEGATADLLRDRVHCFVINPADGVGMRDALGLLYERWCNGSSWLDAGKPVYQYERSNLTAQLAFILDNLSARMSQKSG